MYSAKPPRVRRGRLDAARAARGRTLYGAGGGVQLDVLIARLELGYVFALNRAPGAGRGNVVGWLVFKRLF